MDHKQVLKRLLGDVTMFAEYAGKIRLRTYQAPAALAIVDSVLHHKGLTFVVVISRQGGKNELQAQIESYLLTLLSRANAEMVKASPTFKPQTENAMRRLERALSQNLLTRQHWKKESGYIYRLGTARCYFLSAQRDSNVVGATASTLLECDEAQDVLEAKWDRDFAPMAASTNATTVFFGTVWTSRTLLAREIRAARDAEQADGLRRLFLFDCEAVGREVPAYAEYVRKQVSKLGRNHPLVKTQYYLEEIDAEGGMFPPQRKALMGGAHGRQSRPLAGKTYAILIDVAGEDEDAEGPELREREPRKDSTALTIVEVDLSTLGDEVIRAPTYKVVERVLWTGTKHSMLYGKIKAIAELWQARYIVIDCTGVGAGLSSFLEKAFPGKVLPFAFSPKSKSDLGYGFLAVVDSGRFKDWDRTVTSGGVVGDDLRSQFENELDACQYEILDGPGHMMRWSVPDGTRSPRSGELLHDDLLMSAALCWVLDSQTWPIGVGTFVIRGADPLQDMDRQGF